MPGSYSRNKGRRLEQEIVNVLKDAGIDAKRISMVETGHHMKGDILVANHLKCEVKGGSHVPKFLYNARKDGEDILFARRDRQDWLVCMDLEWFIENFPEVLKKKIAEQLEEVVE
ncbi:hypothetical protein GF360_03300 [candidate division WWE3 bacterium]|nr:hypothetical protein [candidate division WWE3 bacterium]